MGDHDESAWARRNRLSVALRSIVRYQAASTLLTYAASIAISELAPGAAQFLVVTALCLAWFLVGLQVWWNPSALGTITVASNAVAFAAMAETCCNWAAMLVWIAYVRLLPRAAGYGGTGGGLGVPHQNRTAVARDMMGMLAGTVRTMAVVRAGVHMAYEHTAMRALGEVDDNVLLGCSWLSAAAAAGATTA